MAAATSGAPEAILATPADGMRYRPWLLRYLWFIAGATYLHGLNELHRADGWGLGDWLINYHAGFVRRGLTGEVALGVARVVHLSPLVVVLAMQLACYGLMLFVVHRLLVGTRVSFWIAVCVLSPATLAFQVLAPLGGFRKEIILLAGLGSLVLLVGRWAEHGAWIVAYLSVLGVVCALSHESLILYGLYLVAALAIGLESVGRALRLSALPALLGVSALFLAAKHAGDARTAQGICTSLGAVAAGAHPVVCSGAIQYLGSSLAYARAGVVEAVRNDHYLRNFLLLGALAVFPLAMAFLGLWRGNGDRRALRILAVAAVGSLLLSTPLFVYAIDWGRWIYIHVFCIFLLLLMIARRRQITGTTGVSVAGRRAGWRRVAAAVFLAVYSTCWLLPYTGGWRWPSGYLLPVSLLLKATQSTQPPVPAVRQDVH